MKYKITQARNSDKSVLIPKFIVVDIYKIGTHEIANNVHGNQTSDVAKSLIKYGYKGPALSVFETGKDSFYESISQNTFDRFEIEYGKIGIADGHNRLAALKELDVQGKLRTRFIPVQIIPVRKPEIVAIKVDNAGEKIWSIEQIESCFQEENKTMQDSKNTSHFEVVFSDGIWRRISEAQPDIEILLSELII